MNRKNEQTTAAPRMYVCGRCLRIFCEKVDFENHMNSLHLNEFQCATCAAGFLVLIDMIHHMLTHYAPQGSCG